MKSISENSYGARIGNAENLLTALQSFNGYEAPKPELSIEGLSASIADIKGQNNQVAVTKQNYSLAVEIRLQIFEKNPHSIKKILSPINATVKVSFGKNAKETTDIIGIISKMRGANMKSSKNVSETFVSQSYQSYNSKIQFFADLIANLTNFETRYMPTKNHLMLDSLQDLYSNAVNANNMVMNTYSKFVQTNDFRLGAYETLSQNAVLIKENVKAQYGFKSTEYNLIKKLKI
jgi:hypothetical protein